MSDVQYSFAASDSRMKRIYNKTILLASYRIFEAPLIVKDSKAKTWDTGLSLSFWSPARWEKIPRHGVISAPANRILKGLEEMMENRDAARMPTFLFLSWRKILQLRNEESKTKR